MYYGSQRDDPKWIGVRRSQRSDPEEKFALWKKARRS
jgi:hypothetical protein